MQIRFRRLIETAIVPHHASAGAAGLDLTAAHIEGSGVVIGPGDVVTLRTGLAVEIPHGLCGMIVPRSGLGREGLVLANSVGIIDSDYRGEIMLAMWNRSQRPITVKQGDRVAQMLLMTHLAPIYAHIVTVDALSETVRGSGGFGSTGVRSA